MSSCEGAGTFWAGKNVDAAVQGFLQSRLFPQIPARSAGPPLVPMAIKSLGEGCGLKVIHVSLQGNSSTQRIAEEQRERGGTPGSWGDTGVLGSPGTLVQGAGSKATLHGIVGGCETTGPTANHGSKPQCEAVPEGMCGGAQRVWKSSSFPQHLRWPPSVCTLPLAGEGYDVPDPWQLFPCRL